MDGADIPSRKRAFAIASFAAAATATVVGCAGDEEAATTPAAPAAATTGAAASPAASSLPDVGIRLQAAGFNVVSQPLPANVPSVESAFLTGAGPVVVYVASFEAIDPAKAYVRTLAAQARRSGGHMLVRRVDETVYVGTATDAPGRRQLPRQLGRVIAAGGD